MHAVLGYNYAVGGSNALNGHLSSGGFTLDMSSGSATTATSDKQHYVNVHGALMSGAWVLLLPLGTMFPAHRCVCVCVCAFWRAGGTSDEELCMLGMYTTESSQPWTESLD